MRTPSLSLVLCFALSGHASANPEMSPEQAFDLFAKAVLESDVDANEKLHRSMVGINHYEAESVTNLHQLAPALVKEMVDGLIQYKIFSAKSANGYGTLMTDAYARTQCRATGTRAASQYVLDKKKATEIVVQFSCQVPAFNTESGEVTDAAILRKMRKSTKYAFRTWAAMLKRGKQRTLTGETMLTGDPDTGYFPDAYNMRSLTPVLYSVRPAERVDPFADMERDAK
ncbi:hypothetical protein [Stenotrophomonas sp. SMYL11]|uniref:hypothetical protein n=1 Tax=Stenotrophomonas sp. SMYL11 TaxID=3076042 RepID=UPI002E77F7AA|nr:hypothetical protein [Stenotrophomonas sp. SMYL11]